MSGEHWTRKPKLVGANAARLRLSREERSLMARIDGRTSLADLAEQTGLGTAKVDDIVAKLHGVGALSLPEVVSERIVRREPPKPKEERWAPPIGGVKEPVPEPPVEDDLPEETPALTEAVYEDAPLELEPVTSEAYVEPAPVRAPTASQPDLLELQTVDENEAPLELDDGAERNDRATEKEEENQQVAERNYRQVYETRWHTLPADARAAGAREARGPDLYALCFDQDPLIISAILENSTLGLDHVRMIAQHHKTTTGLEMITRRSDWLRDMLIERRLLKNNMIGDIVLNRVMSPKLLFQTYKIAIDRDIPEITRVKVRGQLKTKWAKAPPEQRAELIQRTEARSLILMTGCTFDAKTTAILCGKPVVSAMFVQSFAKFGAAPPALLAHMIKQPFVRKNQGLKKMLLAHPNMPGEAKRNL